MELAEQGKFDEIIINDDLRGLFAEARQLVDNYLTIPRFAWKYQTFLKNCF